MTKGLVLPTQDASQRKPEAVTLNFGNDVAVTLEVLPYDPVTEGFARTKISAATAAAATEDMDALLNLLQPGAREDLARMDVDAIEAAGTIWLAALLGKSAVLGWEDVYNEDGSPMPHSPENFQLACFRVPGFARLFLNAYLAPKTAEIEQGNG